MNRINVISTGNVQTVMLDGIRQFDIEHSYAVDGASRNRGELLLAAMVAAYNAIELRRENNADALALAVSKNKILEFTQND